MARTIAYNVWESLGQPHSKRVFSCLALDVFVRLSMVLGDSIISLSKKLFI